MKNIIIFGLAIFFTSACGESEKALVNDNSVTLKCYKEDPLNELTWLDPILAEFKKPKSGPLTVSAFQFRNEVFIVVQNPTVSSPMSYIYNCAGKTIFQLKIGYNEFYNEAKFIKVFLDQKY